VLVRRAPASPDAGLHGTERRPRLSLEFVGLAGSGGQPLRQHPGQQFAPPREPLPPLRHRTQDAGAGVGVRFIASFNSAVRSAAVRVASGRLATAGEGIESIREDLPQRAERPPGAFGRQGGHAHHRHLGRVPSAPGVRRRDPGWDGMRRRQVGTTSGRGGAGRHGDHGSERGHGDGPRTGRAAAIHGCRTAPPNRRRPRSGPGRSPASRACPAIQRYRNRSRHIRPTFPLARNVLRRQQACRRRATPVAVTRLRRCGETAPPGQSPPASTP
jgi:hypothetical protein